MSPASPPPPDLHVAMYRYWRGRAGERAMPMRTDIDPADLKRFLPHIMLLDSGPDHFRYRLVGSRIVQDFGRDTTGSIAGIHVSTPDYADAITGAFARVRDLVQPAFSIGEYRTPAGLTHSVSRLMLPLGVPGRVNMLLVSRIARSPGGTPHIDWLGQSAGALSHTADVSSVEDVAVQCARWEMRTRSAPPVDHLRAICH